MDCGTLIREKLNEYLTMSAPLDRAAEEIAFSRSMLRVRTEEEIHQIAPVLGALSEALNVSTIEMLLAQDRAAFVRQAIARSGLTVDEIGQRLVEASSTAREDLRLLGFDGSL